MVLNVVRQTDANVTRQQGREHTAMHMDETVQMNSETSETDEN